MTPKPLRFTLGRVDVLDWLANLIVRHPFLWAVAVGLTGFHCWNLFRNGEAQTVPLLAIHGSLALLLIWIGLFAVIIPLGLLTRRPGLGIEVSFSAHEDHFVTESSLGRSEIKWAAIRRLRHGWSHTFLCSSSSQAIFIPYRAFEDPAARLAFDAFCRERIASAGSKT